MPSTSKKQHNFMEAIAHSPEFAKKAGVAQSVGKDFAAADKGKKFKQGGVMKHDDAAQDKVLIKKMIAQAEKKEPKEMKEGGKVKAMTMKKFSEKETMGPSTMSKDVEAGSNSLGKFGQSKVQKRGLTKGSEERSNKTLKVQAGAKGGKGTMNAAPIKMARGGGVELRGKTKGKMC